MEDQAKAYAVMLGASIRFFREELGATQMQFANLLGCAPQQIQKYEKGTNRISPYRLALLVHHFGLEWHYIMPSMDKNAPLDRLCPPPRIAKALTVFDENQTVWLPDELP